MKNETKFAHIGRPKPGLGTPVNLGVTKASTLLFERAEDLYRNDIRAYGRHGSDLHDAVEQAFTELEGGAGACLAPSGHAATTLALFSQLQAGDHVLLTDSAYGPTRSFCLKFLDKLGVETTLYPPRIGAGITDYIKDNTQVLFLESPGSLTFEIQDIPALVKAAQKAGVTTIIDNTWSGGIALKAFKHGIDLSIHSGTKYVSGHSDVLYGAVISRTPALAKKVAATRKSLGYSCAPDDTYQILRGFRSLYTRFAQQEATALKLAKYLSEHPHVKQVLHPALPEHPDHEIWKRDFDGAACLFAVILEPTDQKTVNLFVNTLKLFGIGFSYGGYESVVIPCDPQLTREHGDRFDGPLVRFGAGLEDADDLIADISRAFDKAFDG